MVPVKKKNGDTRFCIDFRQLNSSLEFNAFPSPNISETLEGLGGSELFSTFDVAQAYLSFPLYEESKLTCLAEQPLVPTIGPADAGGHPALWDASAEV